MASFQDILEELGLAKNEAKIYETLLREGESPVGHIADKSGIHRRNVYDSLNRLIEKGLVFEVLERQENRYQPVDPGKLAELIEEKRERLSNVLPAMVELYQNVPYAEELFMYRGTEGWKNYLNDVLRIGGEVLLIAGVDIIREPKVAQYMEHFYKEVERKKISYRVLYRSDTKIVDGKVDGRLAKLAAYRVIPERYFFGAAATVFGDRVVLFSDTYKEGEVVPDAVMTVVKNKDIAKSYRAMFNCIWDASPSLGHDGPPTKS